MKALLRIAILSSFMFSLSAYAANKRFGLGIVLGEPTGLSGQYWLSKNRAIDGAAAWSLNEESSFILQSTYLIYK
ncbi:MAG: hypothetical protein KDD34_10110, partial [Bdellovibrionales bacterium]|nr:hypothetical protein [Bdellovibrionales bacterium]